MRTYGKVKIAFWEDERIISTDDSTRLLALYCKTGKHSNAIGCYRLPLGYIQTDLGWNEDKARTCLQNLVGLGLLMYDEEAQFLFIPDYLEENPIENSRVGKMCVALVDAAMRSAKLFPHLIKALRPHKHRFILNEKDLWEPKWDTVSVKAVQFQHTLPDTVYHTVSDTLSGAIMLHGEEIAEPRINPEQYTLSDTVSDTVRGTREDLVPPEPYPEPEPEPRDDDARAETSPQAIIKAFDEVIIEVFGKEQQRPWPHGTDAEIAREFIRAGADVELCRQLFLKHQHGHKRKGQFPIGSLAYFRSAVPDAVNERRYYQNNPLPENHHDQRSPHAASGHPRARSGHDTFTDALVEVVHERERH